MNELQEALAALGLTWADVWALSADRRAGTLVVVATDGRKLRGTLEPAPAARPPARRGRDAARRGGRTGREG